MLARTWRQQKRVKCSRKIYRKAQSKTDGLPFHRFKYHCSSGLLLDSWKDAEKSKSDWCFLACIKHCELLGSTPGMHLWKCILLTGRHLDLTEGCWELTLNTCDIGLPWWLSGKKNLPAKQEMWVQSLGQEDALEKEMATHSSILVWKIPRTEDPDRLQFMRLQKSWIKLSN